VPVRKSLRRAGHEGGQKEGSPQENGAPTTKVHRVKKDLLPQEKVSGHREKKLGKKMMTAKSVILGVWVEGLRFTLTVGNRALVGDMRSTRPRRFQKKESILLGAKAEGEERTWKKIARCTK